MDLSKRRYFRLFIADEGKLKIVSLSKEDAVIVEVLGIVDEITLIQIAHARAYAFNILLFLST